MGLSSSKQTSKYTPSAQQLGAANSLTSAYQAAQPATQAITDNFRALIPGVTQTATAANNAAGQAAGYYGDVLGGKYLTGNPYLQNVIDTTNNDVSGRVNGAFSMAGRTGGGANQLLLAKALSENEGNLRYGDYNTQMGRMDSAASGASNMASQQLASLLGLGTTTAGLPLNQATQYANGIGSLGIGGTTTQTSSPGLGQLLLGLATAGASAFGGGGGGK